MYDTILFPTDGSDHASRVADHAIDVAKTRDATLHVFSVVDDRAFLTLSDDRIEEVRSELEENALEAIDEAVTAAEDDGVDTESDVDVGNPAECIVDYVADNDVDLVVMGTSGDDYERTVVGSVSRRVVEASPAPVLTVGLDA
ncbi:universal stress protein [Natrialbaceae archaeon AArc-T1-2]|uniref:universal stress protein n=1 Tax=Natrialbaceae archaeon AArc-T1-2 TaxID=3053904 RepID=UPI00255B3F1C|nr:universal stress protein [Natrialbaceae archaeon AArc-T1-2]WIV68115.1 universal stress protein [Natrialbaceae archaeon AArc-T1-2]